MIMSKPIPQEQIKVEPSEYAMTLEDVGVALGGISRERIRQIENRAMGKIKKMFPGLEELL